MKPSNKNLPKIVIVGRPNVGKSTLFNRIIGKRKAVVEESAQTTRDRLSEIVSYRNIMFELIDTGGMAFDKREGISKLVEQQVMYAIKEAGAIIFVCDVKTGVLPLDSEIAELLRRAGKEVILVINKVDNKLLFGGVGEFYNLGFGEPLAVSSLHGIGILDLMDIIIKLVPATDFNPMNKKDIVKIAVVGRPNAGKSLFVNTVLSEERVIVSPEPGTTRDSVDTYLEREGKHFIIIDTAGMRSKGKIKDSTIFFSILRTKESIKRSDVVLFLLDGVIGVTKEDFKIIGIIQKYSKPYLLAINKWDLCVKKGFNVKEYEDAVRRVMKFIYNAPILFMSALTGKNVFKALDIAYRIKEKSGENFSTSLLNEILRGIPIKSTRLYSTSQIKNQVPLFEVIAKRPKAINESEKNFIVNRFRNRLTLDGIPIKLIFREKAW